MSLVMVPVYLLWRTWKKQKQTNKHEHIHKTAFAVITLLFFNYVILRQITGLQQSFYNEQHIAIFLVDVANQTPAGIPAFCRLL